MPFEIVGLDFVGREGREEDMSGVDEVGLFGIKLKKPSWKRFKRNVQGAWKGTKKLATGKAFKHKKKPQPAEIKAPSVPGAPPSGYTRDEQAIVDTISSLGLTGKTAFTSTEWGKIQDGALSILVPVGPKGSTYQHRQARAIKRDYVIKVMKKMGLTRIG
jgi:hypothetical protein